MALIYYSNYDYKKALSLFGKLDDEEIERRDYSGELGHCYHHISNQYDKAIFWMKKHIDKTPDDVWGYTQMSRIYHRLNDHENANKYLQNALNIATNDEDKTETYTSLGINAYLQGNIDDAIKYTQMALEFNIKTEDTAIPFNNLGKYYYKKMQYKQSYDYLVKAIKIDPHTADINGNFGIVLYHLGRIDESINYLEKCINAQKCDDFELVIDCFYIYGLILFQKNKYLKCIEKLKQKINDNNNYQWNQYKDKHIIYYLIAKCYIQLKQYKNALKYLINAQNLNPYKNYKQYIDDINLLIINNDKQ